MSQSGSKFNQQASYNEADNDNQKLRKRRETVSFPLRGNQDLTVCDCDVEERD